MTAKAKRTTAKRATATRKPRAVATAKRRFTDEQLENAVEALAGGNVANAARALHGDERASE